jgi:hypothetical protein
MPVILIVAVLVVLFLTSRSHAGTAAGYGGANQAPPPALDRTSPAPLDRSGGQLGVDAVTGRPFAAGSTFSQIAGGHLPFTIGAAAGAVRSYGFTQPGQAPPPPLPAGGAPTPAPVYSPSIGTKYTFS